MWPEKLLKQRRNAASTLYIDMNSFFASVEQFYDPKLRGRPVAVCAGLSSGATIIAASIEAKRVGIRTGTKVGIARQRCPGIALISDSPNSYREIHTQIMDILHNTPCYVQAKSIDEAYLKIPSYTQSKQVALKLAKDIKAQLRSLYDEHILCSIGLSSNIWLAKMGAESRKPDGLVYVSLRNLTKFYDNFELMDLNGINFRLSRAFYRLGIETPTELYRSSHAFLRQKLGVNGSRWYLRMRGYEVDFSLPKTQKSLGHQITTIPNSPTNVEQVTTVCMKIATTLGARLRRKQLKAQGLYLGIRYLEGGHWGNILRHTRAFDSDYEIMQMIKQLTKNLKIKSAVRKVTLSLLDLTDSYQLDMDLENGRLQKEISVATDIVNSRYGKDTLLPARSYFARSIKLDKVGFGGDLVRESIDKNI